jgi:hypothetical protein
MGVVFIGGLAADCPKTGGSLTAVTVRSKARETMYAVLSSISMLIVAIPFASETGTAVSV